MTKVQDEGEEMTRPVDFENQTRSQDMLRKEKEKARDEDPCKGSSAQVGVNGSWVVVLKRSLPKYLIEPTIWFPYGNVRVFDACDTRVVHSFFCRLLTGERCNRSSATVQVQTSTSVRKNKGEIYPSA